VTEVFADTSGWGAFFIRTDPMYTTARKLVQQWQSRHTRVITTNYILAELIALFTSPHRMPRSRQIQYTDTVRIAS
jgi:uncharacterized protein